jgi:hypothetical protein
MRWWIVGAGLAIAACSHGGQVTDPVCWAIDAGQARPCSTIGMTCVNPGEPSCTCTPAGWHCPVPFDAHAYQDAPDGPDLSLHLDATAVTPEASDDAVTPEASGDDAAGDGE